MKGALAYYLADALGRASAPVAGDGETFSAQALLAQAQDIARNLTSLKLEPAEPVLTTIANRPADLAAMLGIWRAGGVVVPVHAKAGALTAEASRQATGARFQVDRDAIAEVSTLPPPSRPLLNDAALIIFTSGTTGKPKGVVIGHARFAGKLGVLARLIDVRAQDTVVVPLQLTFIFGLWVSLLTLDRSARLVLVPKFTPDGLALTLGDGGTVLAAVPTMLRTMLAGGTLHAPFLRMILTGGESLGSALGAQVRTSLPRADLYDLYGLTETGSCDFCLLPPDHAEGVGSIGRPTTQVAYRLMGEDGRPAADGAPGELQIQTPFGMLGYLDNPSLTAEAFSEGHLRTGDLAKTRPDGRVEIVGRLKDIISRGGNKIAPTEIDALLCSHPDVAAALCAGVSDARLGETIHAIIVVKPGAKLTPEALRHWAAERVEKYKVPDAIHFRDALPTGSTGKVLRGRVAEIALAAGRGVSKA